MKIRLNKYIADCGVTSRRKADELIDSGQVTVNGRRVFELGTQVDPSADKITVKGRPLNSGQKKIYIAFNKPPLVLTSTSDPEGRPTVSDYFSSYKERLYPVGRLDWDSEGLLLMTNDGDFAQEVAHPKKEIPKTYLVKVEGNPTDNQLDRLKRGVTIIGGKVKALHVERIRRTVKGSGKYQWVKLVIS
ncbi:MAG: rRNA pseudouridine synthase [Bdellovibrionales bacterium]|nr:rRNA pseudouridine synthase [Bdellovibrionales bacterium]